MNLNTQNLYYINNSNRIQPVYSFDTQKYKNTQASDQQRFRMMSKNSQLDVKQIDRIGRINIRKESIIPASNLPIPAIKLNMPNTLYELTKKEIAHLKSLEEQWSGQYEKYKVKKIHNIYDIMKPLHPDSIQANKIEESEKLKPEVQDPNDFSQILSEIKTPRHDKHQRDIQNFKDFIESEDFSKSSVTSPILYTPSRLSDIGKGYPKINYSRDISSPSLSEASISSFSSEETQKLHQFLHYEAPKKEPQIAKSKSTIKQTESIIEAKPNTRVTSNQNVLKFNQIVQAITDHKPVNISKNIQNPVDFQPLKRGKSTFHKEVSKTKLNSDLDFDFQKAVPQRLEDKSKKISRFLSPEPILSEKEISSLTRTRFLPAPNSLIKAPQNIPQEVAQVVQKVPVRTTKRTRASLLKRIIDDKSFVKVKSNSPKFRMAARIKHELQKTQNKEIRSLDHNRTLNIFQRNQSKHQRIREIELKRHQITTMKFRRRINRQNRELNKQDFHKGIKAALPIKSFKINFDQSRSGLPSFRSQNSPRLMPLTLI
ncbi:unnamed protein product [Moneuplotes crassus]|uniref:Uncharacterized protein n=1 Tax=Euplotes crassus TaxID=5936 RepID=A0AAD2DBH8_EUPCR|nr:unnamed protein product [Moneuplotes crassus]